MKRRLRILLLELEGMFGKCASRGATYGIFRRYTEWWNFLEIPTHPFTYTRGCM